MWPLDSNTRPTPAEWFALRQSVDAALKTARELKAKYPECAYVRRSNHGLETDLMEISDRYCEAMLGEAA